MNLTDNLLTIGMVAVLLTAGIAATQAAVPGATTQQDGPDSESPDDGGLTVESLTAPDSVAPGEDVTVVAEIGADGDGRITDQVEFRVGGAVVDRQYVTLDGDESTTVTFTANTSNLAPGDVRHGVFTDDDGAVATLTVSESFALERLDAPESVEAGSNATVVATVSNPNDFETTQPVTFRLEGETVDSQRVTVPAGENATVTFTLSTAAVEPGTVLHSVFTRDAGQFAELEVTEGPPDEAAVTFDDQESNGTTVTIENVSIPSDGYVAIHNESLRAGDAVGSVIGVSASLDAGSYDELTVELYDVPGAEFDAAELAEDQPLTAMPHNETTADETYSFVATDGVDDGPFFADGEVVTDDANVTVETEAEPEEPTDSPEEPEEPTDTPVTTEAPTDTIEEPTDAPVTTEEPTDSPEESEEPTDAPVTIEEPTDSPEEPGEPTDAPVTTEEPTDTIEEPTDVPVTTEEPEEPTDVPVTIEEPTGTETLENTTATP